MKNTSERYAVTTADNGTHGVADKKRMYHREIVRGGLTLKAAERYTERLNEEETK